MSLISLLDKKKLELLLLVVEVPYDQSLNTTDSVKFASIKTDALDVSGTMQSGTLAQPPKVSKGDMWLDTTDSSTHPIVRVMS